MESGLTGSLADVYPGSLLLSPDTHLFGLPGGQWKTVKSLGNMPLLIEGRGGIGEQREKL